MCAVALAPSDRSVDEMHTCADDAALCFAPVRIDQSCTAPAHADGDMCDSHRVAQAAGAEFGALYDGLVGLSSLLTSILEAGPMDATRLLVAAEHLAWDLSAKADDAALRFTPATLVAESRRDVGAVGYA
ncbi:hypothetical protein DF107_09165 [Burkholderia stagnalis]|nr:hypothetical protein DF161_20445 [Burkholderia stagnalis]RQR03979.1 hypothetical protein DF031_04550 [Burkholderia stagnalis]RQX93785.1 hypothetical protein DF120_10300 [Burkholderia stagnalis]RQY83021.1 hypothetical protein DF107_09165 [Burkholderia stagnalis]